MKYNNLHLIKQLCIDNNNLINKFAFNDYNLGIFQQNQKLNSIDTNMSKRSASIYSLIKRNQQHTAQNLNELEQYSYSLQNNSNSNLSVKIKIHRQLLPESTKMFSQ